jgi:predicted hydrocarbon binding protein
LACLKTIEKKLSALTEKKDNKNNKKRQTNIEFFKFHIGRLSMLADWLVSPSRKFNQDHMKSLVKYLSDIHISQDDSVFQDDLKEVYEKIIYFAEEPQ